jgi:chaperonin GroES
LSVATASVRTSFAFLGAFIGRAWYPQERSASGRVVLATIAAMPEAARSPKAGTSKPRKKRTPSAKTEDIRLTGDRIVVENPESGERTSRSGLLIPATAAPAPKRCVWGEVLLVGPDVRSAKAGDSILYLPQAGLEVELDGRDCLLLRERDVQAVSSSPNGKERQPGLYL